MYAPERAQLFQWSIWPPAMAGLIAPSLLYGALVVLGVPPGARLVYAALALAFIVAWVLPRLGYVLWCDGAALCFRWGLLRHGETVRIPLADIDSVALAPMPDQPKRPWREHEGVEAHGGNFTPTLNQGLWITLRNGRRIALGLPEPKRFATALRPLLSAPISSP